MGRGQRGIIAEIFLKREGEAFFFSDYCFTRRVEKKSAEGGGEGKTHLYFVD